MAIALGAAAAAPAQAAGPSPAPGRIESTRQSQVAAYDRRFMDEAARRGHAQVQAGQLALAKADDSEVKEYARTLIADHTRANAELKELAQRKRIALPQEPSVLHERWLRQLEVLHGSDFDRGYLDRFGVDVHQSALWDFRDQARQGRDADVRVFAQRRLAALQKHLNRARLILAGFPPGPQAQDASRRID